MTFEKYIHYLHDTLATKLTQSLPELEDYWLQVVGDIESLHVEVLVGLLEPMYIEELRLLLPHFIQQWGKDISFLGIAETKETPYLQGWGFLLKTGN